MRFSNQTEKMEWLKLTGQKLSQMEHERKVEILRGNFAKAYSLLRGINFARKEFKKVSDSLRAGYKNKY